jgi:glucokinase
MSDHSRKFGPSTSIKCPHISVSRPHQTLLSWPLTRQRLQELSKLAIEIGGTKLQAAVGTQSGEILKIVSELVPAPGNAEAILNWMHTEIPPLLAWASDENNPVTGIGVGFGGPVETATGRVLTSHQVEGWDGVELKPWFEKAFELPTAIANDANAAGWAEYCNGAGKGTQTMCYMNIGSGIGGALVINGKLHDGQGRGAFEMGHVHIPDPHAETPGAYEKLERLYSGWSIEEYARENLRVIADTPLWELTDGKEKNITCRALGQAAALGDETATPLVNEIAQYIGLAINNAITLIHPEIFVLGGGVSLMGGVLLNPIRETLQQLAYQAYGGGTNLVQAKLGEDVVIVGALLLAE